MTDNGGVPPLLDRLDRSLVQALMIDGRAPLTRLAAVLDVTDQTVTRRYRRLRAGGLVRVIGLPVDQRVGLCQSKLRFQCAPGSAADLARELSERPDTSWVAICSDGTEVCCIARSRTNAERDSLLLQNLPRAHKVTAVAAHSILHAFTAGPSGRLGINELSKEQIRALERPAAAGSGHVEFDDADRAMLAQLARDGRSGYPELARAAGRAESTVRRRLEQLHESGAVNYTVEILPSLLGFDATAALYLTVSPASLESNGRNLARQPEVPFVAATSGASNLFAVVYVQNLNGLYEYMTQRIAQLEGVTQLEVVPLLRTVKQAVLLTDGARLYDPPGGGGASAETAETAAGATGATGAEAESE